MSSQRWHQHTVEEALRLLDTHRHGLTSAEAARRHARWGPNVLATAAPRPAAAIFAAQFADFMILVLIGAAIISGAIGDITDTVVIAAIVVINAAIGTVQEVRAARAIAALSALAAPTATVMRDGVIRTVPSADLVPGDAVVLEAGRVSPADLRLIDAANLRMDESLLTGESVPVDKHTRPVPAPNAVPGDRRNIAFKGTAATYGRGIGAVVATGMQTEIGRIATLLRDTEALQTPLQRRLAQFGRRIALVVLAICAVVFVTGTLRGEPALPMFLTALSLAVAAIPEALPIVVGVSLALGARKMAARNALIRRLPAVETLGAVTVICADKTGTLTTNRMRVERYWCDGALDSRPSASSSGRLLLEAMAINNDATLDTTVDGVGTAIGDPTEVAMLVAAADAGYTRAEVEARYARIAELPFDSERRCMTTLHRSPDGTVLAITKGAPDAILAICGSLRRAAGTAPLDRAALDGAVTALAGDGLRVLGVAVREWPAVPSVLAPSEIERDLHFLGLIGLLDPPREAAPAAIATCINAGITPVMITGDHPLTAAAIAMRVGLIDSPREVVSGVDLDAMDDAALTACVRRARVYARVTPEQKLRIVMMLQRAGAVVAMTGDGVNDAPALQRADIGIAMGLAGSDVAREASAMVLLDDDFSTIVRAVREGRRVYDNLRRFIRYVLTTNSAEVWIIFLAPLLGLPVPLLPTQILWINLVTDGLPGLALAAEPAERDVMDRPPRPPSQSLFAGGLGAHAFLVGLLMAGLVLGAQAWFVRAAVPGWQTVVFTALCFSQLGHLLAIRSEHTSLFRLGVASNLPLLAAVSFTVVLQLAVVYLPVANRMFKTTPLNAVELAACVGSAAVIFAAVEVEKAWRRRRLRATRTLDVSFRYH